MSQQVDKVQLKDFILAFVIPTVFNKLLLIYFGLHYADYPGEGYGYGVAFCILFMLAMVARFLWKYRNYSE